MKTLFYQIFFKNREEAPLKISVEGYNMLKEILMASIPPKFVDVKGRLISTNDISQIVPVEGR